jgi:hypothetical protein
MTPRRGLPAVMLVASAVPAFPDDAPADKSGYTLFDPTPVDDLRSFNTDRPPKANSPYTVDAGHFQYETDIAVFGYSDVGGVKTQDWTVFDPTLKLGLTNTIDAELQITPYESVTSKSGAITTRFSGLGDTFARLKINVLGDDHGAADFLVNVSHALDARWTWYSELFTSHSFEAQERPQYTADGALTCALKSNLQLDFGGNFSLNDVGPRVQLYAGLSQRF